MKIFCIGSATLDIFFIFRNLEFLKGKKRLFEKNNVSEMFIDIGGGGLNTAFNLKNLNLKAEAVVKLAEDFIGEMIRKKAEEKNIPINIIKTKGNSTLSVIFLNKITGEKYIFTYRGDELFELKDIPVYSNSAYLISTGNTPITTWENIIRVIKRKNNFIGILPSQNFLLRKNSLGILNKCDFIVLNKEEALFLLKIREELNKINILKKFNELLKNVKFKLITFGKEGAYLIYENKIFFVNAYKRTKVVDTTGAGDCFASTLLGFIIKNIENIDETKLTLALKLSAINTAHNLREIGAQTGLLREEKLLKFKNFNLNLKIFKI